MPSCRIILPGLKEIKAFTQEKYESNRTFSRIAAHTRAILRALRLSNAFHPSIEFVSGIGLLLLYFWRDGLPWPTI